MVKSNSSGFEEGIVEPGGRSSRMSIDVSAYYQLPVHLYTNPDRNTAKPRTIHAEGGQDYLPLASTFTSLDGLPLQTQTG